MTYIELTEDQLTEQFPFIENPINSNAPWSFGSKNGCMFETYGEEYEFVKKQDPQKIWTLLDSGDSDDMLICSGWAFFNRVGYFISEKPVDSDKHYTVVIPVGEDD